MTPPEGSSRLRPGTSERRVVAVLLYELNGGVPDAYTDHAIREVLGDDVRFEPLVGGQMAAVIGVDRSTGDEALRAARAALIVANAIPTARVAVAVGRAILELQLDGRSGIALQVMRSARGPFDAARVAGAAEAVLLLDGLLPKDRGRVLARAGLRRALDDVLSHEHDDLATRFSIIGRCEWVMR